MEIVGLLCPQCGAQLPGRWRVGKEGMGQGFIFPDLLLWIGERCVFF